MSRAFALLGRFDVRFRYPIVLVWVIVTVACVRLLPGLSSVSQAAESSFLPAGAPSMQAAQLLDPFQQSGLATATLVVARQGAPLTAADEAAVARLSTAISQTAHVVRVRDLGLSQDGEAVQWQVQASVPPQNGTGAGATLVNAIRAEIAGLEAPPGLQIHLTGELPTAVDAQAGSATSMKATQQLSILFIVVLLLLAFRSLLAPLVTLLPAGLVLALAGPVITLFSHVGVQVSEITQLLLVVLVLGAGTDYGLFLVFRVREEIRGGMAPQAAVVRAVETVGESITFSALIVIGALLSLVIARFGIYQGLGPALAIGIALMLLAGLTLLPAILAILGRAAFWPSRLTVRSAPARGWWGRVAAVFIRRPGYTAMCGLLLFAALALGSLGTSTAGFADRISGPPGSDSAAGQAVLARHFPTTGAATATAAVMRFADPVWQDPAALSVAQRALQGSSALTSVTGPLDPDGPGAPGFTATELVRLHQLLGWPVSQQALAAAAARLVPAYPPSEIGRVAQEYAALVRYLSPDGRTVQWSVVPRVGPPGSAAASADVPRLRAAVSAAAARAGARASGLFSLDAFAHDVASISQSDLVHVIPTVAVIIAILLAIVLRSVTAPLFLVPSVVLSYLAALGLTALVFVHIGGQSGVQFILPFLMFVFLMALGSDYNVLVMTRTREESHRLPIRQAVTAAIGATGSTVTTAGLVLGGTFGVLGWAAGSSASASQVQQVAFGIAAGILMDTFFVRTIVVPSIVALVGRWTWWPSPLARSQAGAAADEAA